VSVAK